MKITLDPKQLEILKEMLDEIVKVGEKLGTELKRRMT